MSLFVGGGVGHLLLFVCGGTGTQKKLVQTSCNQSFVVKFIVPNKRIITSCTLHT